jgi:hypothetical protein
MMPYRGGDFPFTNMAVTALKLNRFLGIENVMKKLYMPFIAFIKPAWPGLQV